MKLMKIMLQIKYYRIDKIIGKESLRQANETPSWAYRVFSNTSECAQGSIRSYVVDISLTDKCRHSRQTVIIFLIHFSDTTLWLVALCQ